MTCTPVFSFVVGSRFLLFCPPGLCSNFHKQSLLSNVMSFSLPWLHSSAHLYIHPIFLNFSLSSTHLEHIFLLILQRQMIKMKKNSFLDCCTNANATIDNLDGTMKHLALLWNCSCPPSFITLSCQHPCCSSLSWSVPLAVHRWVSIIYT